jgi:hypothetical protein
LVIPFDEIADQRRLILGGVDPIDPRSALHRIDRPGRAEEQQRHAIHPGVEYRHRAVQEPDIAVDDRAHRLAGDLGPAMRQRDRGLLMQAQQHLRPLIAEPVDEAVMQAAIARAGIERDIGNIERAHHVGRDIAAPKALALGGQRPLDPLRLVGEISS